MHKKGFLIKYQKSFLFRNEISFQILFTYRINTYLSLVSAKTFECNSAFCNCKQSIILADLNIQTRMQMCASLSYDDIAWFSNLTSMHLCSQTLCVGIAAVLCAGYTFL